MCIICHDHVLSAILVGVEAQTGTKLVATKEVIWK